MNAAAGLLIPLSYAGTWLASWKFAHKCISNALPYVVKCKKCFNQPPSPLHERYVCDGGNDCDDDSDEDPDMCSENGQSLWKFSAMFPNTWTWYAYL